MYHLNARPRTSLNYFAIEKLRDISRTSIKLRYYSIQKFCIEKVNESKRQLISLDQYLLHYKNFRLLTMLSYNC